MRTVPPSLLFAWLLLALGSGGADTPSKRQEEVQEIARAHAQLVADNQRSAEEFARENPVPQKRDFGPNGTLNLDELGLDGAPGREVRRVGFTWVNTTSETIEAVLLKVGLRGGPDAPEWTEERVLRLPLSFTFVPGSSYTDRLRILTGGLHRSPNWQWDVSVRVLR